MNEPDFIHRSDLLRYLEWAKENKKRADRLLAAAKALMRAELDHVVGGYRLPLSYWIELRNAATDYEDKRG